MINIEIIVAVLSSSVLAAFVNSLVNRRRNSVEIEYKINQMADTLIDNQRAEIDNQRAEVDALNGHILQLQKDYRDVVAENTLLKAEIAKLKNDYETQIEKLSISVRELSKD